MARLSEHGIRLSSMSPSFLNSNSTSHTWPFSAVAELIDNALDPGVSARQIWIDAVHAGDQLCLTFTDNGSGMTPSKLHKMLSFGFTEKGSGKASLQAIGVYGNGFKSGSMRLGRDALIFTKNGGCQTVGLLSQTYLENIKAQAVIIPIVPFNQQTKSLVVTEDSEASLAAIFQHSIVNSEEQIHAHFDSIPSKKGTKILIWSVRRAKDGKTEIDFESDEADFRLPDIHVEELKKGLRNSGSLRPEQNVPDMYYSLRAYLSILYLKPRTQIILRGKKILAKLVSKRLTYIEHDVYKPQFSKEKVKVTFGLNPKNKDHYGIMMYHKNRLIKAYEKVGCQLKTSGQRAGIGVIGVIECNFLKPAHNKQDFEYTKEYRLTLGALGLKLNDYWKEVTEKKAREREFQALDKDDNEDKEEADEGPMWLQCEECLKWRSVPSHYYKVTPDSWNCSQNPNPRYRSCSSPEEAEEREEQLTPSYQKNHKKPEQSKLRKREKSLQVCHYEEEMVKHKILSRSSSEPFQSTFQFKYTPEHSPSPMNRQTEEKTFEHDDLNTQDLSDHHVDTYTSDDAKTQPSTQPQEKLIGRDSVIKDKNELIEAQTHLGNGQRLETTGSDKRGDTCLERQDERINSLSLKRKSESVYYCVINKKHVDGQQFDPGNATKDPHLVKPTKIIRRNSSGPVEHSDTLQQIPASHPRVQSLPATQTMVVSPLSRREASQSRVLPSEGGDTEAKVLRLAALEKEVQKLRSILGQEVTKTTQGTMTTDDSNAEKLKQGPIRPKASREVGCQTYLAERSSSATGPVVQGPGPQGLLMQGHRAVCDPKEQAETNRPRKERSEGQGRMTAGNSEACDNSRSAQQNLSDIRNNVVVLLTALLPQLDLSGISLETADVDNILQQIIDVNSLKL
ncbi:MORC family CW-type zinc finger protein 3 isoform 1-T1 [Menidia menidia]